MSAVWPVEVERNGKVHLAWSEVNPIGQRKMTECGRVIPVAIVYKPADWERLGLNRCQRCTEIGAL